VLWLFFMNLNALIPPTLKHSIYHDLNSYAGVQIYHLPARPPGASMSLRDIAKLFIVNFKNGDSPDLGNLSINKIAGLFNLGIIDCRVKIPVDFGEHDRHSAHGAPKSLNDITQLWTKAGYPRPLLILHT